MLKKNSKKLILIIAILIIAVLCIYFFAFSANKDSIEKDGITAKYNASGSKITVQINGNIPEGGTWNYTDSDSKAINDVKMKSFKGTGLTADITFETPGDYAYDFYYYLNNDESNIYADVNIYYSLDESKKVHINNFDISVFSDGSKIEIDSKQEEYINAIKTVAPSFRIIDGITIKSLQNLEKKDDGSYVGGNELSQYTFDYKGNEYDGILSEKIKFGVMLKDLTKHMKELECEKQVFDINGTEVKGYDYHTDDEIYSVCYFVIGETRCFISSNEADFEDTKALARDIIENQA